MVYNFVKKYTFNLMMQLIVPVVFILAGLLAGLIFDKLILNRLRRFAVRVHLSGSEILFASLRGITKVWFFIAGFYGAVLSLPLEPNISTALKKFLTIIFIYSVTFVLAKIAASTVVLLGQSASGFPATLFSKLASILVFMLGTLMVLETLGISVTPILATLGIGGLSLALAFQDILSNLVSSLYLIITGQVRTGAYVKLDSGQEGYVTDITWQNTTIKQPKNNAFTVPTSKLRSAIFTNHVSAEDLTVAVQVGVSYDSDLEQVEKVTIEVAKNVMRKFSDISTSEPFIRYHTFSNISIDFTVFLPIFESIDERLIRHEFIKKLHQRYQQEGIKIPFRQETE